jgi:hypothetical protein
MSPGQEQGDVRRICAYCGRCTQYFIRNGHASQSLKASLVDATFHPIMKQCGDLGIVLLQHQHMSIPSDSMLFKAHEVVGYTGLLQVA